MLHTILTHPGGAHKDDLLAVCILVAEHGAPVVRREPTDGELRDPAVAVVDIGGVHDAASMNFDHHHFDRQHPPTCALSLVLGQMGLYEDALHLCEWLQPAEWFDSRGPNKTAEFLGVPRRAISQLNSPIDVTLLRRFAQETEHSAGEPLYEFMRIVGEDMLQYLRGAREQIDEVARHVERWSIPLNDEADENIEVVFLPRQDTLPEEPSTAVGNYVRTQGLESTVAAIVYPDRRGDGYGIARYEDHPRLDFARVGGQDDVHFAHKSGFMCKTSATEPQRLKDLIAGAWIAAGPRPG